MTKRFKAQVAHVDGQRFDCAISGAFSPGKLAQDILPGLRGSTLFAYMFRRFGYPSFGWDGHKELVTYMVTTPMPNVYLNVRPYVGGDSPQYDDVDPVYVRLMFGYLITGDVMKQYRAAWREWENTPLYTEANEAFKAAIRDLLRPVYVRDVPINCYGKLTDAQADKLPKAAEPYHAAGYPIFSALFESTDRYCAFFDALVKLGNGDPGKGMQHVIALSKEAQQ